MKILSHYFLVVLLFLAGCDEYPPPETKYILEIQVIQTEKYQSLKDCTFELVHSWRSLGAGFAAFKEQHKIENGIRFEESFVDNEVAYLLWKELDSDVTQVAVLNPSDPKGKSIWIYPTLETNQERFSFIHINKNETPVSPISSEPVFRARLLEIKSEQAASRNGG